MGFITKNNNTNKANLIAAGLGYKIGVNIYHSKIDGRGERALPVYAFG
jgi:hypothetical protein